jgi:dihydrofolate reductase
VRANGTIGRGSELVCRISEDLKFFRRTTLGHPIIMGRKTWDSIGRPLPGRRNIVVTRNPHWHAEGAERAASITDALERAQPAAKVFVIGGAELYAQSLSMADELILTEIDAELDGDIYFPAWDRAQFDAEIGDHHISEHGHPYRHVIYRRRPVTGTAPR